MARAINKVTGATVSGDETVLRRLGRPWEVEGDRPKATRKTSTKKSDTDE